MSNQPLSGLKVLDFTTLLPGPLAALILAEAGAEVTKIERPGGEDMRHREPRWGEQSANFALLNRGKKSLALDLKDPHAIAALRPLIEKADIILEQFRPGVMDRLMLGYRHCRDINARIIYCSITGYGASGPKAQAAGHDLNYVADTGLLSLSLGSADQPAVPPGLIADVGGGTLPAVLNILLALINRERTGGGVHLDIAMCDAMFMFAPWGMAQGLAGGNWPKPGGERLTGGTARYQIYPTKDKRFLAAAALEPQFWARFCDAIGLAGRYRDDGADPQGAIAAVGAIIAGKPAGHWRAVFANADCCCCIVATLEEALDDPHFRARGLFDRQIENETGARLPAIAIPIDEAFREARGGIKRAPALGADNDLQLNQARD